MSRAEERKRADDLKVLAARDLFKEKFSLVPSALTTDQLDKIQRVIDVQAINEAVQTEYDEFARKTSKGRIVGSNESLRDPADTEKLKKIAQKRIATSKAERIQVNFERLLAPDALSPTSDNPDEASYLLRVRSELAARGVWLNVFFNASQISRTTYTAFNDPRRWFVQLLLGNGDEFKTETGRLTRDVILKTPLLGGGYYEYVRRGPTFRLLDEVVDRVSAKVTYGRQLHQAWSQNRTEAKPGVVWTSDKLGGATWPSESIWNQPHYVVIRARTLINEGQLMEATKYLILAASLAEWNSRAVHEYIDATMKGASRAKSILEVAVFMGKVAEGLLLVYSVGTGLIRLLGGKGAANTASNVAQRQLTGGRPQLTAGKPQQIAPYPPSKSVVSVRTPAPAPRTPTPVARGQSSVPGTNGRKGTIAETPHEPIPGRRPEGGRDSNPFGSAPDMEGVINRVRVNNGMKPLPAKTKPGPLGQHQDALVQKAHDEFMKWLAANPGATMDQKIAQFDRLQAIRKSLGKSLD